MNGSADPHSTEASTNQFLITQNSHMQQPPHIGNTVFDQSSICITSTSGGKLQSTLKPKHEK